MTSLSPTEVVHRRLASQFLVGTPLEAPEEVVRALGAVQSQDYAGGQWAIGMRTRASTAADVEAAVISGAILRTHVLRPTWHFVAREDIRWMLQLTGPRVSAVMGTYNEKFGLTPAIYRRSHRVIAKALAGGVPLTRRELAESLRTAGIDTSDFRLVRLVMQAEVDGLICSGPRRGAQFTYALLDDRAPAADRIDRDEALARLAAIYFRTRGPASAHDFAWWSGLTVGDARRAMDILGPTLARIEVDGRPLAMIETGRVATASAKAGHLLPNYDEYFIGHRDRSFIGLRIGGVDLVTGGDARIGHVVVVGGQLVGRWKRVGAAQATTVEAVFMTRMSRDERAAVGRARDRLEQFLGQPVDLRVEAGTARR